MGDDVVAPLIELADKSIVVLVKTSNPAGGIVQDVVLKNGKPLWHYMLELVVKRWNRNQNMIPVLRQLPDSICAYSNDDPDMMPILLAGVGAQGGSHESLSGLLNSDGIGGSSTRRVPPLSAKSQQPWQMAIQLAAIGMKNALNETKRRKQWVNSSCFWEYSGVGKSCIIEELIKIDDRFTYISPYVTRPLRDGEKNKIHISGEEMDEMWSRQELWW